LISSAQPNVARYSSPGRAEAFCYQEEKARLMSRTSARSRWIGKSSGLGRRIWLSAASIENVLSLVLSMSQNFKVSGPNPVRQIPKFVI
jgi:hypothetical protein